VEGAGVTLKKDSKKIADAVTHNFGDFPFDDLDEKREMTPRDHAPGL
jgi:hypothetical protein